jgi:hypothetical protein
MPVTLPATGTGTATPIVSTDNVTADSTQVQNVQLATVAAGVLTRVTAGVQYAADGAVGVTAQGTVGLARASTAVPTAVSADGDAVAMWASRLGALITANAPHIGLNGDPWSLVHEAATYTSAQTSTALVAGGASEKIVVTQCQIQAYGTTAFTCQLYFGTGAFSRGTSRAVFDGEFAPSATSKPGVVLNGPFIAGTNGDDLCITTVGAGSVTVNVWYYVVV